MISIIVPVYNVEAFLPQCLDSLIHQTYQDLEIICVNDGSTDRSLKILKQYADKDKRIKLISRENRGISASRNEALDIASGEYVMFVDSDDWISELSCEKALNAIRADDCDLVLWSYIREFNNKSLPNYLFASPVTWENGLDLCRRIVGPVDGELRTPQKLDSYGTVWGKIYKRELIEQNIPIRFVDTAKIGTCEDVLFNIGYSIRTKKSCYIPELFYHYRKLNTSFTSKYREDLPIQWKSLYDEIKAVLVMNKVFRDCEMAYLNRISLGLVGLGLNVTFSDYPFGKQRKMIKQILSSSHYKEAIKELSVQFMPIHWRGFYTFARQRNAFAVLCILKLINRIIR
ncbi:MAG: glycosyltransferase [Bacteroidales bacterium]|nr:glycosyltransferase [Bacteroidales bacterium]